MTLRFTLLVLISSCAHVSADQLASIRCTNERSRLLIVEHDGNTIRLDEREDQPMLSGFKIDAKDAQGIREKLVTVLENRNARKTECAEKALRVESTCGEAKTVFNTTVSACDDPLKP